MDEVVRPDAPRNWRDRVALAAYAESGEVDLRRARHSVDRAVAAAGLAAGLLAILGAIVGFTTAGELLRRANGPVHAAAALMVLAGVPWLLVLLRGVVLAILRRRGGGLIGRLVPAAARTVAARDGDPSNRTLGLAVANQLGRMLAGPAGRWLATFGSGLFWCGYALAAFAAIWLLTARVALGFGWESSWLPPELGQAMVETSAAPLQPFFGDIELEPVDPPPITAADDHTALELRRVWVIYLSGGVLLYLLLPMVVWTILAGSLGHLAAERWRPHAATGVQARAARKTDHRRRTMTAHALPDGDSITAVAGLERPAGHVWPPPLAGATTELNIVHDANSLAKATRHLEADSDSRVAIVAWLPSTPDRGVERQVSALTEASGRGGVLVLDGGDALRSREPSETVAIRHADWSTLAKACGVPVVDFDFAHLTNTSQAAWLAFLGGTAISTTTTTTTDLAPLDASFAAISAALDADPPLPDERTAEKLAGTIFRIHGAASRSVLQAFTETMRDAGRDPVTAARAISQRGRAFLPARLRGDVRWAAIGGLLGALACVGATVAAPAAAVALPAWAMSGAGLGGVLGLLRRSQTGDAQGETETTPELQLSESVLAAAMLSVLLWKQGEGERAIGAALISLCGEAGPPVLIDAGAARNWLALARTRLLDERPA